MDDGDTETGNNKEPLDLSLFSDNLSNVSLPCETTGAIVPVEDDGDDDTLLVVFVNQEVAKQRRQIRRWRSRPWENPSINDEDLSVWEIVQRYKRPVSAAERLAKKNAHKSRERAEEAAKEQRAHLEQQLGQGADEGLLDLFSGTSTTGASAPAFTTNTSAELAGDDLLFGNVVSGGAEFADNTRDDLFELCVEQASDRNKPPPYKGAYKHTKAAKWSIKDLEQLYDLLSKFGADPCMINAHMTHFTNKEICRRLQLEQKKNPDKYGLALTCKKTITTAEFESIRGRIDPSTHYKATEEETDELRLPKRSKTERRDEVTTSTFSMLFGGGDGGGGDRAKGESVSTTPGIEEIAFDLFGG